MHQELILQRRLQKAIWCGRGACPTIYERWAWLRDELITHTHQPEVARAVESITHSQHNLFGYPNEERGLWLEFEGNGMRRYYEKEKADVAYFVGCKTSFLISAHQQALVVLKELAGKGIDFAVLGSRECIFSINRGGTARPTGNILSQRRKGAKKKFAKIITYLKVLSPQKIVFGKFLFLCVLCAFARD